MSSVTFSAAATGTAGACSTAQYQIPVQDASCALVNQNNATDVLSACCKNAPVVSYANGCAHYCLASGQSVGDLIACLQDNIGGTGYANYGNIFCSGNNSATATGSVSGTAKATSSGASGTQTGTATGTAASGSSTTGAASGLVAQPHMSKGGLIALGMLLFSAAAGAML